MIGNGMLTVGTKTMFGAPNGGIETGRVTETLTVVMTGVTIGRFLALNDLDEANEDEDAPDLPPTGSDANVLLLDEERPQRAAAPGGHLARLAVEAEIVSRILDAHLIETPTCHLP